MNMMTTLTPPPERLTTLAELLRRFERDEVEQAVDLLIDMLDATDGDPEAEPATWTEAQGHRRLIGATDDDEASGDDRDIAYTEWQARGRHKLFGDGWEAGTGQAVAEDEGDEDADPREEEDVDRDDGIAAELSEGCASDEADDPAWIEWHSREGGKLDKYAAEVMGRDRLENILFEDDEDDDPREADVGQRA